METVAVNLFKCGGSKYIYFRGSLWPCENSFDLNQFIAKFF